MIKITSVIYLCFFLNSLFAQVDLSISTNSFTSGTSLRYGDNCSFSFDIVNEGDFASNTWIAKIVVTSLVDNAVITKFVSIPSLLPHESAQSSVFIFTISSEFKLGRHSVDLIIPDSKEFVESSYLNNKKSIGIIDIIPSQSELLHVPYPIVFLHGMVAKSEKWDVLLDRFKFDFGWSFGGRLDYCLNADGNVKTALLSTDIFDLSSSITIGDLYTINFDIDPDGSNLFNNKVESNQAASFKQAKAIQMAIKRILGLTGRDKVVLVGHSSGGIAARTYLQYNQFWQSDSSHHVAKVYTMGTAHGGSNATLGFASTFMRLNELSEATRDIRTSYYSGANGIFIYGGIEDPNEIKGFMSDFVNVDVNCNGRLGDTIVGLNSLPLPEDVNFACGIGTGSVLNDGDGAVPANSANINNFLSIAADTFLIDNSKILGPVWHTELPDQFDSHVRGIDEANDLQHAYELIFKETVFGTFTMPSNFDLNNKDIDCFKFNYSGVPVTITLGNLLLPDVTIDVYDKFENLIFNEASLGRSTISFSFANNIVDDYYLKISSIPNSNSFKYPYYIKVF